MTILSTTQRTHLIGAYCGDDCRPDEFLVTLGDSWQIHQHASGTDYADRETVCGYGQRPLLVSYDFISYWGARPDNVCAYCFTKDGADKILGWFA